MGGSADPNSLRVSLEPHLATALRPLVRLIPKPLSAQLHPLLEDAPDASTPTPTISYDLLSSVSKWARSEEGVATLSSQNLPLNPQSYSMVALLAGTRTSPDKKFPQGPQASARSGDAAKEISDRRAIVAVLNAFLSVICAGIAAWWISKHTGWRDEWRVLLALLVSSVVAISEIGLYIIWDSHYRKRSPGTLKLRQRPIAKDNAPDTRASHDILSGIPVDSTRLDASSQASSAVGLQGGPGVELRQRAGAKAKPRSL
ncbi:hypothetical protein BC834DRAFT_348659 [Gloeopeniophorella convolvens]|nr:hypothetical protein BC834DRAFT_348659 [Gloeopeniophorella convolvens]